MLHRKPPSSASWTPESFELTSTRLLPRERSVDPILCRILCRFPNDLHPNHFDVKAYLARFLPLGALALAAAIRYVPTVARSGRCGRGRGLVPVDDPPRAAADEACAGHELGPVEPPL